MTHEVKGMPKDKSESQNMKKLALLILVGILLGGCSGNNNTSNTEDNGTTTQTTAKAPEATLHEAALNGNLEAIQKHIAAGFDLDEKAPDTGASPLITAAAFGQTEIVKALLEGGADVNFKNKDGSTALHTAAFLCYPEIVEILLDKGADKNSKNKTGSTALDSVSMPFTAAKPIYDMIGALLGPLGLKLDYEHIQATRPKIAEMLK
jgi:uncharacterized protein